MDVVDVFLWFANESFLAAEEANEQRQREIFLQLGSLWTDAANQTAAPNAAVVGGGAARPSWPGPKLQHATVG
jgi:hypothetical protein